MGFVMMLKRSLETSKVTTSVVKLSEEFFGSYYSYRSIKK